MKLSILFPCYNEESAIEPVFNELLVKRESLLQSSFITSVEIIVCDDGSTDESYLKLQQYKDQIQIIRHEKNQGYGAALKTSIQASSGDVCVFYDLDGTCKASDLLPMIEQYIKSNVQLMTGSRLHPSSSMPAIRQLGNRLYVLAVKLLFGSSHSDVCSGYRMFDRKMILNHIEKLPNDLSFTLVLTLRCIVKGVPFSEMPTLYDDRLGRSKLSEVKDGVKFLYQILFCFFNLRLLKR